MKIAFLNLYSGINDRGAESFAHSLAGRLGKKHEVVFYSGGKIGAEGLRNISIKTPVRQPVQGFSGGPIDRMLKRLFLDWASLSVLLFSAAVLPKLLKGKYDLVIPMNGFWEVVLCKLVSVFIGCKILITGHSGPGWDERWNLYLKPDVFIATTGPTAVWARRSCPWVRVEMIPYGIDLEIFSRAAPAEVDLSRPLVLCPAAAVSYKRVDMAIKAVAALAEGSLLHLGTGPLVSYIESLGERMLQGRFISDRVPYGKMPGYYTAADVVTLPSSPQENSPMVFLEAMAAGKPVVTTDTPRNRWILGEAGVYVDTTDIKAYKAALLSALENKNPKKIYAEALRYSWDKILSEYEKVLSSLNPGNN